MSKIVIREREERVVGKREKDLAWKFEYIDWFINHMKKIYPQIIRVEYRSTQDWVVNRHVFKTEHNTVEGMTLQSLLQHIHNNGKVETIKIKTAGTDFLMYVRVPGEVGVRVIPIQVFYRRIKGNKVPIACPSDKSVDFAPWTEGDYLNPQRKLNNICLLYHDRIIIQLYGGDLRNGIDPQWYNVRAFINFWEYPKCLVLHRSSDDAKEKRRNLVMCNAFHNSLEPFGEVRYRTLEQHNLLDSIILAHDESQRRIERLVNET